MEQHELGWVRPSVLRHTHLNTVPSSNTCAPPCKCPGGGGLPSGVNKQPRAGGQGILSVLVGEMKQGIPNFHSKEKQEELGPNGNLQE